MEGYQSDGSVAMDTHKWTGTSGAGIPIHEWCIDKRVARRELVNVPFSWILQGRKSRQNADEKQQKNKQ